MWTEPVRTTLDYGQVNVFLVVAAMFAALSTVEPPILDREAAGYLEGDAPWVAPRLRAVEERIRDRLGDLSRRLGEADWLDGAFGAGDLMMVDVLRRLAGSGLLEWDREAWLHRDVARDPRR